MPDRTQPRFWLPVDIVLELATAADSVGGVGAGRLFENDGPYGEQCGTPVCLYGLAAAIDGITRETPELRGVVFKYESPKPHRRVLRALFDAGITWRDNDNTIPSLATRLNDFTAYLDALGVGILGVDDVGETP